MRLRRATLAALVISALVVPTLASAGESAGWQAFRAKDYKRAESIWKRDAARGEPNAAFGLGVLAEKRGDDAGASTWYEKAAAAGLPAAQVLIAQRYATGKGVTKNLVVAYAWYSLAIRSGVPNAAKIRDQLAKGMSADAVKEAEALAATLVKE